VHWPDKKLKNSLNSVPLWQPLTKWQYLCFYFSRSERSCPHPGDNILQMI